MNGHSGIWPMARGKLCSAHQGDISKIRDASSDQLLLDWMYSNHILTRRRQQAKLNTIAARSQSSLLDEPRTMEPNVFELS